MIIISHQNLSAGNCFKLQQSGFEQPAALGNTCFFINCNKNSKHYIHQKIWFVSWKEESSCLMSVNVRIMFQFYKWIYMIIWKQLNNLQQCDVLANFYSTLLGYLLISPVHFNANFSRLVSSTSWSNMFQATMKTIQYYKPKRPKPLCIPLNGWNLSSLEIKSRCCNI